MTTANKITLARIAMIPFFVVFALMEGFQWQAAALALFCIASATDFLDGYIARKYNQVTDFGKFVDPLADKLLVTAALVIFVGQGLLTSWMVFIILAREFIITSLRNVAAAKGQVMAASWSGKVKTCVQIAGIILIFLLVIYWGWAAENSDFGISVITMKNASHSAAASSVGIIGGADGPTAILTAGSGHPLAPVTNLIGLVVTLVTLYSGFDYLKRNWALVAEGATRPKK
ncbi:MAG: CDP-diacylglycerol--glycerol-3-phosphate 3-phosphatidyltransferase [Clostridiaceae bacterium]|nr:CDP-diacylglycerol--glycerol-3-phosphate 3-phosphatidyltransferase [Clostridiaceae bacterium]